MKWRENIHNTLKYFTGKEVEQCVIDAIDAAYLQGLEDGKESEFESNRDERERNG